MMKKGQIQLTFNWIYIAIAGAVILLFFLGIVVKQAKVSEEKLSGEVVRILDSILAGAGVSEKTKNFIDASGLRDYTLYFDCEEGVSEFGIKGKPARSQNSIDPLFAPKEIRSHQIIIWSLPYTLPFKVIDFLMVTSYNNKYYLVGSDAEFVNEFLNATEGFNREYIVNFNQIEAEKNLQVRIIDVDGSHVPGLGIPQSLSSFEDKDVSAVVFTGNQVDFYQKKDQVWKKLNKDYIDIVSLGRERDAAKFAAAFAGDDKVYQCNMRKAFKRLEILTEVYGGTEIANWEPGGKLLGIVNYYGDVKYSACTGYLTLNDDNAVDALATLNTKAAACQLEPGLCMELIPAADNLKIVNDYLRLECITIY